MKTKEMQQKLAADMRTWQKIENASVASTGRIIERTDNAIIRMIMEIIQSDSQMHYRVQKFIADSLESEALSLTPEDLAAAWDAIEDHLNLERRMVQNVREALESVASKNMVVQEYLLHYLLEDEQKHDHLLESLEKIKKGMYPYG